MSCMMQFSKTYIRLQVKVSVASNGKQCSDGAVQLEGVQLISFLYLCVCVCRGGWVGGRMCGWVCMCACVHVCVHAWYIHT